MAQSHFFRSNKAFNELRTDILVKVKQANVNAAMQHLFFLRNRHKASYHRPFELCCTLNKFHGAASSLSARALLCPFMRPLKND
jgi:hypothetical protein